MKHVPIIVIFVTCILFGSSQAKADPNTEFRRLTAMDGTEILITYHSEYEGPETRYTDGARVNARNVNIELRGVKTNPLHRPKATIVLVSRCKILDQVGSRPFEVTFSCDAHRTFRSLEARVGKEYCPMSGDPSSIEYFKNTYEDSIIPIYSRQYGSAMDCSQEIAVELNGQWLQNPYGGNFVVTLD